MLFAALLACQNPYVDDPAAFVNRPGYRRRVLRADLVSTDNSYAVDRLDNVGRAWADLPERDPLSLPVTSAVVDAVRTGAPIPFDPDRASALAPADLPQTEAEWVALGKRVFYEYPVRVDPVALAVLESDEGPAAFGFLQDRGAWVGLRVFEEDGEVQLATTCARCHATRGVDGFITGAQSNRAMDVGASRLAALDDGGSEVDSTHLDDLLRLGPGRSDVLPDNTFNPYAFPDFGGLADMPYLHHNANWVNRGTATLAVRCDTLFVTSTRERSRPPPVLSWAIAAWIRSLPPLPPSDPQHPRLMEGMAVFDDLGCAECHTPPLYTSDRLVFVDEVGTDASAGESHARATGYYRIPSLRGVGNAAPYLHHGAFDTLEEMFDSDREEPGHPWGLDLDPVARADLISFLKTL